MCTKSTESAECVNSKKIVAATASRPAMANRRQPSIADCYLLLVFHPIYLSLNSREAIRNPRGINAIATAAPSARRRSIECIFNSVNSVEMISKRLSSAQSAVGEAHALNSRLHWAAVYVCIVFHPILAVLSWRTHCAFCAIYVFTSAFNGICLYGHVQLWHCFFRFSVGSVLSDGATQFVLSFRDFVIKLIYSLFFVFIFSLLFHLRFH